MFRKVHDTIGGGQIYTFVDGEIVFNSINRRNNYFTINRGRRDGVFPQMGVMAPKGLPELLLILQTVMLWFSRF
jgi:rod shape-determining protein MreC